MRYAMNLVNGEIVIVKKQLGKVSYLVEGIGRVDYVLTSRNMRML